MIKLNFRDLFALAAFMLLGAVPLFAQQGVSDEKKALIREFRELTGTLTYEASGVSKKVDFTDAFTTRVDDDKELTENQKQDLRKFAAEARARTDIQIQLFFADKTRMQQILEDAALLLFDRNLTEGELREAIVFYKTPAGRKMAKFMPGVQKQLVKDFGESMGRNLQDFITPKINAEVDELKKRIAAAKEKKN